MSGSLYTVEQAAERLKLHPKTVLRMIREGRLKAARIGKAYRIAGDDLDAVAGVARAEAREASDTRATRAPSLSAARTLGRAASAACSS